MAAITYYTSTELATIKQEINVYLSDAVDKEIKKLKNTATLDKKIRGENSLLALANEVIQKYEAVTSETDGITNNMLEVDLQTLVEKVYKTFPTLLYPR